MQPTGKTILLADDDEFVLVAYKDGLEHAGYSVTTARNGDETLTTLRTTLPNMLLLDLIMPNTDGFDVLKAMKAEPALAQVPVVVFTNLSQPHDQEQALALGAVDFITKADTSLNDLVARLDRILAG